MFIGGRRSAEHQDRRVLNKGFSAWNRTIGKAVEALGSSAFPARLEAALRTIVDFDILMTFGYWGSETPICCHHNIERTRAKTIVDAYLLGPYLLDPFYTAARDSKTIGVRRLRDMAPDQFYMSEYYKQHYVLTGIRDEVGLVCRPANWSGLVLSFTRPMRAPAFGRRDMSMIRTAEPLLRVLLERHWSGQAHALIPFTERKPTQDPIKSALEQMTNGILTAREIQIASLILRGHSSASIAETLRIATGTVKIHRKNIHQELRISHQSELFGMFIRHLSTEAWRWRL